MRIDNGKKDVSNKTEGNRKTRKEQSKTETPNKRLRGSEPVEEHSETHKKCVALNSVFYMSAIPSCNQSIKPINRSVFSKFQKSIITKYICGFEASSISSPFESRITSIVWHPKYPAISAAASQGGDLLWHHTKTNYDRSIDDYIIQGVGAGGSILGLQFSDSDPATVYTASMTGNICCKNFHNQSSQALLSLPVSWDNWFTSLDICYNRNLLMTGDCSGFSYLVKTTGEVVWKQKKLHSGKITSCDFNKRDPNIFVTSSNDHTVKLWDIRFLPDKTDQQPLLKMKYERSISSACFSPSNRLSLLVTDQHSRIHVYSSPAWSESFTIAHPHRHFQHTTPIKAVWHPLEDILVVGRSPDDPFLKQDLLTIDFYDGSDGELLHRTLSPSGNIVSLNAFNCTGDTLLSAAGFFQLVYMKNKNIINGVNVHHGSNSDDENNDSQA